MKQLFVKKGQIIIEDVPAPVISDGAILMRLNYSLISPGTETAGINASGESTVKKGLTQPEKIKQVLDMIGDQGLLKTTEKVLRKIDPPPHPIGYSCSGTIIEIGKKITDLKINDRVACAGAGYASHAEIVCVPRNLVAKIPDELDLMDAASMTIGSIAMQGVRRANISFGETVAVIGLGLIGQIVTQILKSAGCHVIGFDLNRSRIELAQKLGMDYGLVADENSDVENVMKYTSGYGVDATIITAATKSDAPVQQAMNITRRKGRVVVVGDVGLNIRRQPFYEKEIDFLISCSYGPGRYDRNYEEGGLDYPYSYVRWTENRNMQEYLRMLAEHKVDFRSLISKEYNFTDAIEAYSELIEASEKPLGIILKYNSDNTSESNIERKIIISPKQQKQGIIKVGIIGAGNFAQNVHLPNLKKLSDIYDIHAVVTRTGNNAKQIAKKYGASYCSTDYQEVLLDKNINMVLIATRHNLHSQIAMESLKAGKSVFLEKPMAVNQSELQKLVDVIQETQTPFMVGFNRRFSPFIIKTKKILSERSNPIIINYRVNAGYMPDHWTQTEEGGGRVIGEACHMFDLLNYLVGYKAVNVNTSALTSNSARVSSNDNFIVTIQYADGSICVLTYTDTGSTKLGKEYIEIFSDRKTIIVKDFKEMQIFGNRIERIKSKIINKGHLEEIKIFADCINGKSNLPIPVDELVSATEISFEVDARIKEIAN